MIPKPATQGQCDYEFRNPMFVKYDPKFEYSSLIPVKTDSIGDGRAVRLAHLLANIILLVGRLHFRTVREIFFRDRAR
jgi:hypothetical protein